MDITLTEVWFTFQGGWYATRDNHKREGDFIT